ncbi:MAG: alanine racemase [Bdellovibrionales bacterium]|nr:alanine racemase [Bdellovibrionales bacterium]
MHQRATITLFSGALVRNYLVLHRQAPHATMIPMIKADAYGHGAIWAARTLAANARVRKSLYAFGVATFREALELRRDGINGRIIVFSDCAPWTPEKAALCRRERLEPVLSEMLSLLEFQKTTRGDIEAHVEVNTGMNRMGVPADSLSLVRFIPRSVFTHLADADHPKAKLTRLQIKNFEDVTGWARSKYPHADLHFANSSTLWNAKQYPLLKRMNVVRPGLSLYGIRPFDGTQDRGLKRVMEFSLPVLNRVYLERGDQVGYGGTYTCRKKSGEWVSILGGGYADGVFRSLSNAGIGVWGKKKLSFLGRVSMDLCAVQGDPRMKVGDSVVLWGNSVDPYDQAGRAGTIPYEITTRIGKRTDRIEK